MHRHPLSPVLLVALVLVWMAAACNGDPSADAPGADAGPEGSVTANDAGSDAASASDAAGVPPAAPSGVAAAAVPIVVAVTTFAGTGMSADGKGAGVTFSYPEDVAVDAAGNVYVAEVTSNSIRKVTAAGVVTTLAGSGAPGFADGTGVAAAFNYPMGLTVDAAGNVYVADKDNHAIRKVTPAGVVTTVAGSGTPGFADGTGAGAKFNTPTDVAVDAAGNLYVADLFNHSIRKVTAGGVVTTLAGAGPLSQGFADGTGAGASFHNPVGVALDAAGNVYVGDQINYAIRKVTPAGVVTTLAGSGSFGSADGTGAAASFNSPTGVTVDAGGNVYVADEDNHRIRKVTPAGVVTTLAGSTLGYAEGTGAAAMFSYPSGVAADAAGNIFVADSNGDRIRKVTPAGVVTTLAGTGRGIGLVDATGVAARFNSPSGVVADAAGNVYVADSGNSRIRKVTPAGVVTTLAGGGAVGSLDGTGAAARFVSPFGIAIDAAGNLYVGDSGNNRIRKVTPAGVVTTLAGSGTYGYADGTGTGASFRYPTGVAVDGAGNVYVDDRDNSRIRKVTPAGVVTTLAGSGTPTFADGTGAGASFNYPQGIAADAAGNVYVGDRYNHRIRKVTPAGVVTTLAGSDTAAFADGTGAAASFLSPHGVAVDDTGNVFVADYGNNRIRQVTPAGVATTLAGSGAARLTDGTGATASFDNPSGVTLNAAGDIYVADYLNGCIRKVSRVGRGQLAVTWAAPSTPGSSAISGYTASASAAGHSTQSCTSAGPTLCTISGLTSGVAYSVSVTATNAAGTSAPSASTNGTPN